MTTNRQFERFLTDIQPSATTVSQLSAAHQALRDYLRGHPKFKQFHLFTFLTGSYRRDTAIRPRMIDGELAQPDIDIIVVTNHTQQDKPGQVLGLIRQVLAEAYELDDAPHTRSVGIKTKTVDMDVVAIIAPTGYWQKPYSSGMNLEDLLNYRLFIPDKKLASWQETNPPKQLKWSTEMNQNSNCMFKPLVKLVKWWRRESPTPSKRPKGFVIECMIAECMDLEKDNYEEAFLKVLEGIVNRYATSYLIGQVPWIADPGVPGNSVTRSLTPEQFTSFYKKIQAHAALGRQAQAETDPEKALQMWRNIFGDRFPSSNAATKSLLAPAFEPTSLTFPNKPIAPRKPSGFA